MKTDKKNLTTAKKLIRLASPKGALDEKLLSEILSQVKKLHPSLYPKILLAVYYQLQKFESESKLLIESAFPIDQSAQEKIKKVFEKNLQKPLSVLLKEDKQLIGGVRITQADNVWENSIAANIERLEI